MTDKTFKNHIKKCGDLKAQLDELQALYDAEKKIITDGLNDRKATDYAAYGYLVRLATFAITRFDSKSFKEDHAKLYSTYQKKTEQTRFTVASI